MSTTSSGAGRGGTIASAVVALLALLVSLGVIVLTDDDVDLSGGASPGGGVLGGTGADDRGPGADTGADSGSDTGEGAVEARPDGAGAAPAPVPSECTETACPTLGPPTGPPGAFPYPPGTTSPEWTDDFCAGNLTPGTTVRQVRGSLTGIRDWYITHLLDAGYGWGGADGVRANPFNADNEALGWDALLTTSDPNVAGNLALEHADDAGQTVCGPGRGVVFITVELP